MLVLVTDENRDLYRAELETTLYHSRLLKQNPQNRDVIYVCRSEMTESDFEDSPIVLRLDSSRNIVGAALVIKDPAHPIYYDKYAEFCRNAPNSIMDDAALFYPVFAYAMNDEVPSPDHLGREMAVGGIALAEQMGSPYMWTVCTRTVIWGLADSGLDLYPLGEPRPHPEDPSEECQLIPIALPVNRRMAGVFVARAGINLDESDLFEDRDVWPIIPPPALQNPDETINELADLLENPENREFTELYCRISDKRIRDFVRKLTDELANENEAGEPEDDAEEG